MISLGNLKTTLNAIKCLLNDYAKKKDVPTKLPNPKRLNFTGAVKRSYDGSKDLTVEILSRPDWKQNDSTAPNYIKNRPFYDGDEKIVKIDYKYLPFLPKPDGESYLTFSSPNSFTLHTLLFTKTWDGTLEYFASDETWTIWDGTNVLSAVTNGGEYVMYLRGTGNTVIAGGTSWQLQGSDIACTGNIETLLDYATVRSGKHPTLANNCYAYMFSNCTSLTQAPELPATTLANNCYAHMFVYCTSLTQAPELPATTLANNCYYKMFSNCTSLTQAPELPATTLAEQCYYSMFEECTSLTQAPELPATTLAEQCYYSMFEGCTSLTQAPELPATTLAEQCYERMFMFCTSLKLSTTKTEEYTQEYRIPFSGDGTIATNALDNMFGVTGGTFTETPSINTTYYLSFDNMIVRGNEIATLNGYVQSMIDSIEIPSGGGSVPTNVSAFTNDAGYLTLDTLPKYEGIVE